MLRHLLLYLITGISVTFMECNDAHNNAGAANNADSLYNSQNHLQPPLEKAAFDTLHSWDLGWALLQPINIATTDDDEIQLVKRLSAGQKMLYFFWYLDAEVTNGGFIQFYWNGRNKYLPQIIDGLKLIQDSTMLDLVTDANKEYVAQEAYFKKYRASGDWSPLYENLKKFEELDSLYYLHHDNTMSLIEKYARQFPEEFVKLK